MLRVVTKAKKKKACTEFYVRLDNKEREQDLY